MQLNTKEPKRCAEVPEPLTIRSIKPKLSRFGSVSKPGLSLAMLGMLASACLGQTLTTVHNFGATPDDGTAPGSGVIVDEHGNLFGTTGAGGVVGGGFNGVVFEISPPSNGSAAWKESILHRFTGTPDGLNPQSRLLMTSDGALFGTTNRGGANGLGTAYTVNVRKPAKASTESIIHDFGSVAFDIVTPNLGFLKGADADDCHKGGDDSCSSLNNNKANSKGKQSGDDCEDHKGQPAQILVGADQGGVNNTGAVYTLALPTKGKAWVETILYNFKPFQSGDAAFRRANWCETAKEIYLV